MKKQRKLGFLALIGLVAVASIFTVCKASGAGTGTGEQMDWKVTFDTAGGVPEPETNPVTVAHGETIGRMPSPEPAKDGFIFGGWLLENTPFYPATRITRDITLRANWISPAEENCFHVIFDGDGGVFSADYGGSATYVAANVPDGGTVEPFPIHDVTRTGHTFGGWWTGKNGLGTEFTESTEVSEALAIEGVIVLYAKWTAHAEGAVITYTVEYNAGEGEGAMEPSVHTYGVVKRLSPISTGTIRYDGHDFEGWATSEVGQWLYSDNDEVPDLADSQDAVVPLYAVWSEINYPIYTVTFDKNGGDSDASPSSGTATHPDYTVSMPTVPPTRTGYDFDGWNTAQGGGGDLFTESTPVSESITVWAQWEVFSTVTYKMNNGSGDDYDTAKVKDPATNVGTLPNDPAWAGHVFLSWNTQDDGNGGTFTAATEVTGDIDVYAQWEAASTVTYKTNDGTEAVYATKVVKSPDTTVGALPANPAHAGWGFLGWNTAQNGSGGAFIATTEVSADITVYAKWKTSYSEGDIGPAGGYIFYVNPNYATNGWRYMEASPQVGTDLKWGDACDAVRGTETGATVNDFLASSAASAIGIGKTNTDILIATGSHPAAAYCANLSFSNNDITYDDWFLPSKEEVRAMGKYYDGVDGKMHWSSTMVKASSSNAFALQTTSLTTYVIIGNVSITKSYYVRAARRF